LNSSEQIIDVNFSLKSIEKGFDTKDKIQIRWKSVDENSEKLKLFSSSSSSIM